MKAYMTALSKTFGVGRVRAIEEALNEYISRGVVLSKETAAKLRENLGARFASGKPFTRTFMPRRPNDVGELAKIRSQLLNRHYDNLHMDLWALFSNQASIGDAAANANVLSDSEFQEASQAIASALENIFSHKVSRKAGKSVEVRTGAFSSNRNGSDLLPRAVVDTRTRKLKLEELSRERVLHKGGTLAGKVEVSILTDGISGLAPPENGPDNLLNDDEKKPWVELVSAEVPTRTAYDGSTYDGAIVQVTVTLKNPSKVNLLQLLPLGSYPLKILDVAFDTSTSGVVDFTTVPGFEATGPLRDWYELTFQPTTAKSVRITLLQETYKAVDYFLPKTQLLNAIFWRSMIEPSVRVVAERSEVLPSESELSKVDDVLSGTSDLMKLFGEAMSGRNISFEDEDDLKNAAKSVAATSKVLNNLGSERAEMVARLTTANDTGGSRDVVHVRRFEYPFGLHVIDLSDVEYMPVGEFSSPKFAPPGPLYQASILVDESHMDIDNVRSTSIEYQLEFSESKVASVLPEGITTVKGELLSMVPSATEKGATAKTRFKGATSDVDIYENGLPFQGSVTFDNVNRTVTLGNYRPSAIYVADYDVDQGENYDLVGVSNFGVMTDRDVEEYVGTDDSGRLRLKHFPFVAYEIINDEANFKKSPSEDSLWTYAGPSTKLVNAIASTDPASTITVLDTSQFLSYGSFGIGSERFTYTGKTSTTFTGVVRATAETEAADHAVDSPVGTLCRDLRKTYDQNIVNTYIPISVTVNGTRAINLTDYEKGEHLAFRPKEGKTGVMQFIHVGKNLHFSKPLSSSRVFVKYDTMADYVRLHATLRSTMPGPDKVTPIMTSHAIKMFTGDPATRDRS